MERYKLLMIIPALLLLASLAYIAYLATGPGFNLDIDFRGGTQVVLENSAPFSTNTIESVLATYSPSIRTTSSLGKYSAIINLDEQTDTGEIIDALGSAGVVFTGYSIQAIGPALSSSFLSQSELALLLAFVFMAVTVFIVFRQLLPSTYVIISAFADIVEAFAASQFLGIPLSLGTFAALLLLVGYSVDTDILLTSRVLKGEGHVKEKIHKALITGITMTGTTFAALLVLFVLSSSQIITQMSSILLIGIVFDNFNTWITNAGLLRWDIERKHGEN